MTGCVSNTNTTKTKRKTYKERENGLKNKLRNLCPCHKKPLHTFMTLLSPPCQYNGIKLQEKGGSISCCPQTTLQFLFYFDANEILSILLWLLVNSILTIYLFISGQAQFSSYLVPGGWCQTLLFTG